MSDDSTRTPDAGADAPDTRPVLRVVRGDASPEDIAVLTALLAAAGGGGSADEPKGMSLWRSQARNTRRVLHPGPDAWRASSMPH